MKLNPRIFLRPIALLYGLAVTLRNVLFDLRLIPSTKFDIPIIAVGNLVAGGAGKTPFIEYLIRLLSPNYRMATISRGYKRKTSGFVLATTESTADQTGDEACRIKRKFPHVTVAVDANRRRAIRRLLDLPDDRRPQIILLDDAFQHRYVRPTLSILLTEADRLYSGDKLLPEGMLREPAFGARRADFIIITKCGYDMNLREAIRIETELNCQTRQHTFYTAIAYERLEPVFPDDAEARPDIRPDDEILLITGIANPDPLIREIRRQADRVTTLTFPDHHQFTEKDIARISAALATMTHRAIILCTEKDAARILSNPLFPANWRRRTYAIPITIRILLYKEDEMFHSMIMGYLFGFPTEQT